ncbi:MAG: efflux RND transporter periplasmic adaptor subunit [Burkholderiaceae bacterium]|nr:efflux RND transporter periplasmic adaptor subunit [Burkholderiaceae bacterium]
MTFSNPAPLSPVPPRRRIGLVALIVLALLALFAGRIWYAHHIEQARVNLAASTAAQTIILTAGDVARAQVQPLVTGLPVTGTLRARDTALVKAQVTGVLHDLTVREGDPVSEGQIIAHIAPAQYDQRYQQARLQADAARAQVDIAKRQYDNNAALVQQGFISQTALATSRANLEAAQANYRAAQAGAAVAQQSVADTVLKAPIAGTVSRRLAQPGESVVASAPVVEIVDLSDLELQAPISPSDSLTVRVGQTARLTVEGAPDAVTATVTRINPSAQPGSRDVLTYLTVPTQAGLRQGLFAQGMLTTGAANALAVPLDAVRTDKPQPYVQVVRDGRVHLIPVQIGARGVVRHDAASQGHNEGEGQTWVAVSAPNGAVNTDAAIQPGDWVLRSAAGALYEGTMATVKLTQ